MGRLIGLQSVNAAWFCEGASSPPSRHTRDRCSCWPGPKSSPTASQRCVAVWTLPSYTSTRTRTHHPHLRPRSFPPQAFKLLLKALGVTQAQLLALPTK